MPILDWLNKGEAVRTAKQAKPYRPATSPFPPTSGNSCFYPDFIAKLEDEQLFVIKYKDAVGQRWGKESSGSCLFLMAVELDNEGRNAYQQIEAVLAERASLP